MATLTTPVTLAEVSALPISFPIADIVPRKGVNLNSVYGENFLVPVDVQSGGTSTTPAYYWS